jgi:serine phosphatase RsbU (regulator of sigma subunit)
MRCASARRPIIIDKDGERHELKGDRHSVGGTDDNMEKQFSLHELELSVGDAIYQFSDGISDQFGGDLGKKLKKTRLLQLLDEYTHLNMVQQGRLIRQKFYEWKGNLPQVDDIILVGIRI